MPNNRNDNNSASLRQVNRRLDNLDSQMKDLYNSTYSTRVDNKNDLSRISTGIGNNLDDLLSTVNGQNISDISTLLLRIQRKNSSNMTDVQKSLEQLTKDNTVMDSINMSNIQRFIQAQDYQYDLIIKYMPKLYQALEIMKDNVLSSDNFTKDFVTIIANKSDRDFLNIFNNRARKLKEKYKVQDLFEEMYMDASIYGEFFLYHVPYKKAFDRLLARKNATVRTESAIKSTDSKVLFEASHIDNFYSDTERADKNIRDYLDSYRESNSNVILQCDPYNIIPDYITEVQDAYDVYNKYESLTESFNNDEAFQEDYEGAPSSKSRATGYLKYDPNPVDPVQDGFFNLDSNKSSSRNRNTNVKKISGSVIHKIERDRIIPVYIGEFCLGYYYFNIVNHYIDQQVVMSGQFNSITNNYKVEDTELDRQNDMLVGRIAADISKNIDAKFINQNVDLKEEIYAILRYNDQFNPQYGSNVIQVTFIPAEDVHHFFFKQNRKTHRGISDLDKSIVPAMLYILLYLTDTITKVSRSQDHRIYYVKQNVETNVAHTMLNVINQLKKGNMGMRQLENLNTIFNVIGKYNDFVIPRSQSGESPIEFEVMPGQQSETPTELMDKMQDDAISSTDVPSEFVQSVNQVDFATRFTMSNSKFLRKVFRRQAICQEHFTQIFRKLYNFEYNENETSMEIRLPAPAFLTMTNSQQLLDNTAGFVKALADIVITDQEELKPIFIKNYIRNLLGSYIDFDVVDDMIEKAKQDQSVQNTKNTINDANLGLTGAGGDINGAL